MQSSIESFLLVQGKADRLLQSALMLPPREALSVGLVDYLVPKEGLLAAAEQAIGRLLVLPDAGRIATKKSQRLEFCHAWQLYAVKEAAEAFKQLETPQTQQALQKVMTNLTSRKSAKL